MKFPPSIYPRYLCLAFNKIELESAVFVLAIRAAVRMARTQPFFFSCSLNFKVFFLGNLANLGDVRFGQQMAC